MNWFQHAAARRRLDGVVFTVCHNDRFQHAAARRRLDGYRGSPKLYQGFQHAAARRRLGTKPGKQTLDSPVSTRSRPKAAGTCSP